MAELAAKLGRTVSSIRSAVARGADWVPPRVFLGKRLAWRLSVVDRFLRERGTRAVPEQTGGGAK